MTWYYDPEDQTLATVEFEDSQGNTFTVASSVSFDGRTTDPAPDAAIDAAVDFVIAQASQGNTQVALEALVDLVGERWTEGSI